MRSARSEQRPDLLRIVSAGCCALIALYWLGVAAAFGPRAISPSFPLLLAALAIGSLLAMISASAVGTALGRADGAFRAAALGLGLFAPAHAFLLYGWTRGDSERFVWVIRQAEPCSGMGGGPGGLWAGAMSIAFAVFAASYALRRGPTRRGLRAGLAIASGLTLATAAAMFPDPTIYARILGCL